MKEYKWHVIKQIALFALTGVLVLVLQKSMGVIGITV
jgi:hypothetical protein